MLKSTILAGLAAIASASPAHAQSNVDPAIQASFAQSANAFTTCLTDAVKFAMMSRLPPATFEAVFPSMCTPEEAAFRKDGIAIAMAHGKSRSEAEQEIDGNIRNGRSVFLADHRRFSEERLTGAPSAKH